MKKILLPLALIALAGTAACSRTTEGSVRSAGQVGSMQIVLGSEALLTGQVGLHAGNAMPFGTAQAELISAITAIRGRPTEVGTNPDCPTGAVQFAAWGPFFVHFDEGRFVGWVLDGATNPPITNDRGLAVGVRRDALDADAEIVVDTESTLGAEISVDGIGAILESAAPNARIQTLFSGITCFAR